MDQPITKERRLSGDRRDRYARALAERSSGWVYLAAILVSIGVLTLVIQLDSRGWIKLAGAIIVVLVAGIITQIFVSWRKKSILENLPDHVLRTRYEAFQKRVRFDRWAIYGGAVILITLFAVSGDARSFALGILAKTTSPAECVVESQAASKGDALEDGEAAPGIAVLVNIRNAGNDGTVKVKVDLETSEGAFNRYQEFSLAADQGRELRYQFHEPTDAATDITYSVTCTP